MRTFGRMYANQPKTVPPGERSGKERDGPRIGKEPGKQPRWTVQAASIRYPALSGANKDGMWGTSASARLH